MSVRPQVTSCRSEMYLSLGGDECHELVMMSNYSQTDK